MITMYGPKKADHPSIGKNCPVCQQPFVEGDFTTLMPVEAGFPTKEDEEKAISGRPHNIECEEIHYTCAPKNLRQ